MNLLLLTAGCLALVVPACANLNLYLDQEEVKRLLGLENRLYYVQDGSIKKNAIGYLIPVPSWIDVLHFTWQISTPHIPLNYKLSLSSSDTDIISVPRVNISTSGIVPSISQVFGVSVPCSGRKSGIVVISIDIILSQLDVNKLTNTTLLSFKRTKECQLFFVETLDQETDSGSSETSRSYVLFFTSIGGCIVFLIIVFTAVIVTWLRRRSSRKYSSVCTSPPDHQKSVSQFFLNSSHATTTAASYPTTTTVGGGGDGGHLQHGQPDTRSLTQGSLRGEQRTGSIDFLNHQQLGDGRGAGGAARYTLDDGLPTYPMVNSVSAGQGVLQVDQGQIILSNEHFQQTVSPVLPPPTEGALYQQVPSSHMRGEEMMISDAESKYTPTHTRSKHFKPHIPIEEIAVDRLSLTLGELLHEGTFGRIYQGRLDTNTDTKDVMVKTVVMGSSSQQATKLVSESSRLYGLTHKHVLPLLATTSDGSSPMMIYAYTNPGNLKKWLISSGHQVLSTHQCVLLGLQLLTALKHLHKRHIIHKDVSTRNCFLTGNLSIRLADSSLTRDLFPNDYHCLGDNENRPVKWMAVECISGQQPLTNSSDVWSWGVTLWEILTRGQQPFPDVDPFEMENYLLEGFRLHHPINCPDQLYSVMASCWAHNPVQRSSVHNLYTNLSQFNNQLQQYV